MDPSNYKELVKYFETLKKTRELTKTEIAMLATAKKQAKEAQRSAQDTAESFRDMQEGLDNVGENFGLRLGSMFEQIQVDVEQTSRDISTMFSDLETKAPEIAANIAEEFNSSFRNALPDPKDIQAKINMNSLIAEFKSSFPEMGAEMQKAFKTGDIATFYKKFGDEGMKNLQRFMKDKQGFGGLKEWLKKGGDGEKSAENFRKKLEEFEPAAQKTTKVVFGWDKLFKQVGDNILNHINLRSIIDHIMQFDNHLSNIKREFGIPTAGFAKADAAMQGMVKKGTQFGLTMEQSFGMVKNLSEEARSNNVQNLADMGKALAAIPQATGMASEAVGQLAGQMMFFGANSDRAKAAFVSIQQNANRFGLNVTKVGKTFASVFPRYARMGFKGGEESLARMAAKAEKMGVDLGKMLDMSDKFLDINDAIEASADLSLLGGAAAQVSFTDLMRAAAEGGDALIDITSKMTSDIGKLNKDGSLSLTLIDRQKIKAIAQATNQDVESLTNQVQSRLQDQAKKAALPPGIMKNLSDEEKDFLMSKMVNKGGQWKFEGLGGIQDLKKLTPQMIQAQMNAGKNEALNAEKRAAATQSFQETMTRFIEGLHNEMLAFKPILDSLKKVFGIMQRALDGFAKFIGSVFGAKAAAWAKPMLILGTVLMLTLGPANIARFIGGIFKFFAMPMKAFQGMGSKIAGAFKGAGGAASSKVSESLAEKASGKVPDLSNKIPKKGPTVLQQFTKINPAAILSLAAALVALGIAMLLIGKGIQFAATGFATLVKAFNETKNAGMALAAIGVVMVGFVAMLYLMVGAVAALAAAGTAGAVGLLALGASLLMVGAGIYFAAAGFSMLVNSFMQLGKYSGSLLRAAAGMVVMGGALAIISPALLIFGAASLIAVPGMLAFAALLNGLAAAKGINPKLIEQIGSSMGSIAWGLVKLGLAAGPAAMAMISAGALLVVAVALKNISSVDVKKVSQFGQSLSSISLSMILGLAKLGLVAPYAVLAMISAGSIWAISKALSKIAPVNLEHLKLFGKGMEQVGSALIFGLIKLGLVSPFTVLAIVSAGGINLISRLLKGVKPLDPGPLVAFGQALGAISASMVFGLLKLSLISPFVVLGIISAGGINLIARLLKSVPVLSIAKLGLTATAMAISSGRFAMALLKLGLVSVLTPLALIGALGILGVTKMLKAVPALNAKTLTATAGVVSKIVWPFTKAFLKLQPLAAFTPLALIAAAGILGVTKMLKAVPMLNPVFLITTSKVLSKIAWPFTKSLAKLGLLAALTPMAVLAAFGILKVTKFLSQIVPLNPVLLITTAIILNAVSGKFGKSLAKLGLLGFLAIPAIFSAKSLVLITKLLSNITPLNTAILFRTAFALSLSAGPFSKGLKKIGLLLPFSMLALASSVFILRITKNLAGIPFIDPVKLTLTALAMQKMSGPMSKGLIKIAFLLPFAGAAAKAASSIFRAVLYLSMTPQLNPAKLFNIGLALSSSAGPISKGLKQLSSIASIGAKAVIAASSLRMVSMILLMTFPISVPKMMNIAVALSSTAGPISKGLMKLSAAGFLAKKATVAASNLFKVTKLLSLVVPINSARLINIANTLNKISGPLFKGFGKFLAVRTVISPAVTVASGILKVSQNLSAVKRLNPMPLIMLATTLSNISGKLFWGLTKFAASSVPILPANAVAYGVYYITKTLASAVPIDTKKLSNIAFSLAFISPVLSAGLKTFAKMGSNVMGASVAAMGIVSVTNSLRNARYINSKKLINIGDTLFYASPRLSRGFITFSRAGYFAGPAIVAARSLIFITRMLRRTVPLNFAKMFNIGFVLNATSSSIASGTRKLSRAMPFIIPAIVASRGLIPLSKNLSLVKFVPFINMMQLGMVLNSTTGRIVKGLAKFLGIRALIGPAVTAAKNLVTLSVTLRSVQLVNSKNLTQLSNVLRSTSWGLIKGIAKFNAINSIISSAVSAAKGLVTLTVTINRIQMIFFKTLSQLSTVLNSVSPSIFKAILKFSAIGGVVLPGLFAARRLVTLTKTINQIQQIFSKSLLSIGTVLTSVSGVIIKGLIKFAAVSFFVGPAILSAIGVRKLSRILIGIIPIPPAPLISLAVLLNTISGTLISGLIKWSAMLPFIFPAVIATYGVTRIFRSLASIANLKIDAILTQIPIINSLVPSIIKFSSIGLFAGLLVAAGFGLSIVGKSLKSATSGFISFSLVPWGVFTAALPTISGLTQTLISFGLRGISASSGIIAMASSLNALGKSLNSVSSSFGASTKSMSEYNNEKAKLKTVASAPSTNQSGAMTLIQRARASAAVGTDVSGTRGGNTAASAKNENASTTFIQIKPIQIDLKLNGRTLQSLIVEANYNRT